MEAKANLRDAEIQLSYTEIKTPIAGRIGRAAVSPGNLVGPDSGVLATVVQDDPMQVLFSVTQREMLEARDSEVTGKVRAASDWPTARSTVRRAASIFSMSRSIRGPMARRSGRSSPIPMTFSPSGQTVRVIVEEKGGDQVLVIPQSAVAIDQTGSYVFVVGQDNKVEQRRVRLGTNRDGVAVVEEGLEAGDRVVVQGQQRIRAGMVVAPQLATSPAG